MSVIENISYNATARQARLIVASPESLRECADRLEAAAAGCRTGESVICDLTPSITMIYAPREGQALIAQLLNQKKDLTR